MPSVSPLAARREQREGKRRFKLGYTRVSPGVSERKRRLPAVGARKRSFVKSRTGNGPARIRKGYLTREIVVYVFAIVTSRPETGLRAPVMVGNVNRAAVNASSRRRIPPRLAADPATCAPPARSRSSFSSRSGWNSRACRFRDSASLI